MCCKIIVIHKYTHNKKKHKYNPLHKTQTRNKYLVVFIDKIKTTVSGDESGDLFLVLLQKHSDALTNSGIGLLGLDTHLFHDQTLGVGSAHERVLPFGSEKSLIVVLVVPPKVNNSNFCNLL